MVEELIHRFGSLGIVVGSFFEGSAVLAMGGALAHEGLLRLPEVVLAAFAGSAVAGQIWFLLGRRFGQRLLARRPSWQARAQRVGAISARWGDGMVVGYRFVAGLHLAAPFMLGASGYRWQRFAALSLAGAAVWSVIVAWLGWIAGAGFQRAAGRFARWEEIVIALLILVAGLGIVRRLRRSRRSVER